jgi:UDP-N-acetylmuramate dehydrogenase
MSVEEMNWVEPFRNFSREGSTGEGSVPQDSPGYGGQLSFEEPLSKHTYYRIGGPATVFAVPQSLADLKWLWQKTRGTSAKVFFLGLGSNLLVSDSGFRGLVIKTHRLDQTLELEEDAIVIGASVPASSVLRYAAKTGLLGFEFLAGVPGGIGGCVTMNAGTHLGEVKDQILWADVVDFDSDGEGGASAQGEPREFKVKRIHLGPEQFEYRKCLGMQPKSLIVRTGWKRIPGDPQEIQVRISETLQRRKETQPLQYPSCGSVFKNPKKAGKNAWQVIDALGLRGHRIGNAAFSEKHSNFIVNLGGAAAHDVDSLIRLAQSRAKQELGIDLECEVRFLGDF